LNRTSDVEKISDSLLFLQLIESAGQSLRKYKKNFGL